MMLSFNNSIRVYKYDGVSGADMMLCEIPSTNAQRPNRYVIPTKLLDFLRQVDGAKPITKVISEYIAAHPGVYSQDSLAQLVNEYCIPKGFLIEAGSSYTPASPASNRADYLYIKVELISSRFVELVSLPLRWLFHKKVLLAFIPVFIAVQLYFFFHLAPLYRININGLQGLDTVKLLLLLTAFGLAHELGHATALMRYGGKHISIGWGLYITFPVFYTDISEAWRLPKRQRAIVDVGGIYFHGIICVILVILAGVSYQPLLVYCFYGVSFQIAASLNPFLRMDAYWLVADMFGIADLRRYVTTAIASNVYRILRRPVRLPQGIQPVTLGPRSTTLLLCYSALAVGFFLFLYLILLYQMIFILMPGYPDLVRNLMRLANLQPTNWLMVVDQSIGFIFKTLAVIGFGFMVWRACRRLIELISSVVRSRDHLSLLERLLWILLQPRQAPVSSKP